MPSYQYWVEVHTLNEESGVMSTQTGQTFTRVVECDNSYQGEQILRSQFGGYNKEVRVIFQGPA